jgi:carboxypeptidase C (cathepsin A)
VVDPELTPSFQENMHSWYNNASMLYLESPAGVGYSTNNDSKVIFTDLNQSEDAMNALLDWYAKFPEFKVNELFVSGESYGGIYVPYLAWQINSHN